MPNKKKYDGFCIPPQDVEKIVIQITSEYSYFDESIVLIVVGTCCAYSEVGVEYKTLISCVRERLRQIYLNEN